MVFHHNDLDELEPVIAVMPLIGVRGHRSDHHLQVLQGQAGGEGE